MYALCSHSTWTRSAKRARRSASRPAASPTPARPSCATRTRPVISARTSAASRCATRRHVAQDCAPSGGSTRRPRRSPPCRAFPCPCSPSSLVRVCLCALRAPCVCCACSRACLRTSVLRPPQLRRAPLRRCVCFLEVDPHTDGSWKLIHIRATLPSADLPPRLAPA